jgi:protein gp37
MSLNKTKIDWPGLEYTLNPVVGCKTDCLYCYAKRMNDRFKWIPKWDDPQWFPERLNELYRIKKPSRIFIGSMCDLFGGWIRSTYIQQVIETTKLYLQHEYMFLTKYPNRYSEFENDFGENCWLGVTVEQFNDRNYERLMDMSEVKTRAKKFISIEPLLGELNINLENYDLVIVGAMTGPDAIKPEKDWIESIKHDNIHYKQNIKKYL